MREAWLEPALEEDSKVNMPDLGYAALEPYENGYLDEVVHHLSLWPRWLRRLLK